MDKYTDTDVAKKIKSYVFKNDYEGAAAQIDTLEISRIKNASTLCLIGEVLMKVKRYTESEEVLLRVYNKNPKNRRILDLLTTLYIEMGEYSEAEYYYKEFISYASRDLHRYILRFRIDKGRGERNPVLIDTLEKLKEYEYVEEWAYELAALYDAEGEEKKCIRECDEIVLWFGHGEYVDKAIALKCKLTGEPLPEVTTVEQHRAEEEARLAEEAAIRAEEERRAAEQAAIEAEERRKAEEAERAEAERQAAEDAAKAEEARLAMEAEAKAAEEAARAQAQRDAEAVGTAGTLDEKKAHWIDRIFGETEDITGEFEDSIDTTLIKDAMNQNSIPVIPPIKMAEASENQDVEEAPETEAVAAETEASESAETEAAETVETETVETVENEAVGRQGDEGDAAETEVAEAVEVEAAETEEAETQSEDTNLPDEALPEAELFEEEPKATTGQQTSAANSGKKVAGVLAAAAGVAATTVQSMTHKTEPPKAPDFIDDPDINWDIFEEDQAKEKDKIASLFSNVFKHRKKNKEAQKDILEAVEKGRDRTGSGLEGIVTDTPMSEVQLVEPIVEVEAASTPEEPEVELPKAETIPEGSVEPVAETFETPEIEDAEVPQLEEALLEAPVLEAAETVSEPEIPDAEPVQQSEIPKAESIQEPEIPDAEPVQVSEIPEVEPVQASEMDDLESLDDDLDDLDEVISDESLADTAMFRVPESLITATEPEDDLDAMFDEVSDQTRDDISETEPQVETKMDLEADDDDMDDQDEVLTDDALEDFDGLFAEPEAVVEAETEVEAVEAETVEEAPVEAEVEAFEDADFESLFNVDYDEALVEDDGDEEDDFEESQSLADEARAAELLEDKDDEDDDFEDIVDDTEDVLPDTVVDIFSSVTDLKGMKEQLARTFTKFDEFTQDGKDVLAPYDINFVVTGEDSVMKSQLAVGIAKVLNTHNLCDKTKIVRATAADLNKRQFAPIFDKLKGGCLIVEQAGALSDRSAEIIDAFVSKDGQDVAIVLEEAKESMMSFWQKHQTLRGKFLNVINVERYNENELIILAESYAKEKGYEITQEAKDTVLKDIFIRRMAENQVGYEHVMALVDQAIENVEERNVKNLYMTVLDNKYQEASMFTLLPEDFQGI